MAAPTRSRTMRFIARVLTCTSSASISMPWSCSVCMRISVAWGPRIMRTTVTRCDPISVWEIDMGDR